MIHKNLLTFFSIVIITSFSIAQRVGIGSTQFTPSNTLDVKGNMSIGTNYTGIATAAPSNGLLVEGNVGIGTTAPTTNLDVYGTASKLRVYDSGNNDQFLVRTGSGTYGFSEVYLSGQTPKIAMYANPQGTNQTGTGSLYYPLQTAGFSINNVNMAITVNGAERFRILTTGNVGIGTTNPQRPFHVTEITATNIPIARFEYTGGSSQIELHGNNASSEIIHFGVSGGSNVGKIEYNNPGGGGAGTNSMTFTTNSSERMRIDNAGNVGIGTTSPANTLEINKGDNGTFPLRIVGASTSLYIGSLNSSYAHFSTTATSGFYFYQPLRAASTSNLANHLLNLSSGDSYLSGYGGNVGIGTTNTNSKLTVSGAINILNETNIPADVNGNSGLVLSGYNSTGSVIGRTLIGDGSGYNLRFSKRTGSTTTDLITFTDAGYIGIGTTNPGTTLSVAGASGLTYGDFNGYTGTTVNANNLGGGSLPIVAPNNIKPQLIVHSGLYSLGNPNGALTYRGGIALGGGVGIYSLNPNPQGSPLYGDLRFYTTIWNGAGYNIIDRLNITLDGNVGIGTSAPAAQLHTTGTVRFSNYASGILSVDASGNLAVGSTGSYAWQTTGNAGTTAGTNFIGTTDAIDWVVKTNNSERIRVLSGGNVGIGVTSPIAKLDIASGTESFSIRGNGSTVPANTMAYISAHTTATIPLEVGGYTGGGQSADILRVSAIAGASGNALVVKGNGNVGVGTTTVNEKLELNGKMMFSNQNSDWAKIFFESTGDAAYLSNLVFETFDNSNEGFLFRASGNNRMFVRGDGNVGIGTTNPLTMLYVAGDATTTGFSVIGTTARIGTENLRIRGSSVIQDGSGTSSQYLITQDNASGNYSQFSFGVDGINTGNYIRGYGVDNILTLATASTERMRILANGNVGINTTAPAAKLDIIGTSSQNQFKVTSLAAQGPYPVIFKDGGSTSAINMPASMSSIEHTGTYDFNIANFATGYSLLLSTEGTEKARILSNGNFGIGTNSPIAKLDIEGDVIIEDNGSNNGQSKSLSFYGLGSTGNHQQARFELDAYGTTNQEALDLYVGTSGLTPIRFWNNGVQAQRFYHNNAGSNTPMLIEWNSVSEGLRITNGYAQTSGSFLRLISSGFATDFMNITFDGNIGIGTNTPSTKLDIYGNVSAQSSVAGTPIISYIKQLNNSNASSDARLFLQTGGASGGSPLIAFDISGVTGWRAGVDNADDDKFKITSSSSAFGGGNDRIIIKTDGNMGIGTTTPNSTLSINGSISTPVASKTTTYTLTANDHTIFADASGGTFTITLPSAVSIAGRMYIIKKTTAANTINIAASGAETIDGAASVAINAQYDRIVVQSDGSNWMRID